MSAALSRLATLSVSRVISTTPMLAPMPLVVLLPGEAVIADAPGGRFGDARRLLGRAISHQYAEFIAAQTRDGVGGAHMRLQQSCHVAQQPVAGRMTAGIVDHLELVQVDVQQRVRTIVARALCSASGRRLSNSRRLIRPVNAS